MMADKNKQPDDPTAEAEGYIKRWVREELTDFFSERDAKDTGSGGDSGPPPADTPEPSVFTSLFGGARPGEGRRT